MRHIPVEIAERIIDCCSQVPPTHLYHISYPILRSCARVCREWRPRSQFNLFHHVVLRTPVQMGLFQDVIRSDPAFLAMVIEVTLAPSTATYLPFVLLLRKLNKACHVNVGLDWGAYPPRYTDRMGYFGQVHRLHLVGAAFKDLCELQGVIASFPGLRSLQLTAVKVKKQSSQGALMRLRSKSRCNSDLGHVCMEVGRQIALDITISVC
ncbi:hypothetical protein BD309DRAFT_854809 [Dichomitus squalens]|uniref:Uncharacterized protein n=1 Tax=Dichomitus squalens TaxID=114155 RepID=A0A4Q9P5K7_9APHY|nr:hypothetical protein BD311DRAFT_714810 [Dichomitus squalens]TBU47971.1 hypothetical protein BD309DRAFT_854809 [Dichomitus squalens]